jgi:hypothetical protein
VFLHLLPTDLLDDAEREERSSLPYPGIVQYAMFADAYHWDKAQVDRQDAAYIDDLLTYWAERAKAKRAMAARMKHNRPERQWYDGLSYAQIRAKLGVSDDRSDDVIDLMIGRDIDDDDDEE